MPPWLRTWVQMTTGSRHSRPALIQHAPTQLLQLLTPKGAGTGTSAMPASCHHYGTMNLPCIKALPPWNLQAIPGMLQILQLDKAWRQRVIKQNLAELAKENTDANRQQTVQELALTRKEHEAAKEVCAGHPEPPLPDLLRCWSLLSGSALACLVPQCSMWLLP